MSIRVKLYRLNFFIFIFLVLNITCYAEVFDAGSMAEFRSALSQAENTPNNKHKIDITGDIILDSPISEALNLEMAGVEPASIADKN